MSATFACFALGMPGGHCQLTWGFSVLRPPKGTSPPPPTGLLLPVLPQPGSHPTRLPPIRLPRDSPGSPGGANETYTDTPPPTAAPARPGPARAAVTDYEADDQLETIEKSAATYSPQSTQVSPVIERFGELPPTGPPPHLDGRPLVEDPVEPPQVHLSPVRPLRAMPQRGPPPTVVNENEGADQSRTNTGSFEKTEKSFKCNICPKCKSCFKSSFPLLTCGVCRSVYTQLRPDPSPLVAPRRPDPRLPPMRPVLQPEGRVDPAQPHPRMRPPRPRTVLPARPCPTPTRRASATFVLASLSSAYPALPRLDPYPGQADCLWTCSPRPNPGSIAPPSRSSFPVVRRRSLWDVSLRPSSPCQVARSQGRWTDL